MDKYSKSSDVYSPEGRIHQIEYAIEAVKNSTTIIALATSNAIILSTESRSFSPLLLSSSSKVLSKISDNAASIQTGIISDANILSNSMQRFASNFSFNYNSDPSASSIATNISRFFLSPNSAAHHELKGREEKGFSRPFGVSLMIASRDEMTENLQLVEMDSSGKWNETKAAVSGSASETVSKMFEDKFKNDDGIIDVTNVQKLNKEDGLKFLFRIYNNVMEKKMSGKSIEIGIVEKGRGFWVMGEKEKQDIIENVLKEKKEKELHEAKNN